MNQEQVFFAPVVYEHAAAFIRQTPWTVSRSSELMAAAHSAAYEVYHHTPITVGIDIYNVEAEAYGATVEDSGGTEVPAIRSPLLESCEEILDLQPFDPEEHGRCPLILQAAETLRLRYPAAAVSIPIGGPFSVASNLVGFETLLTELFLEEETVRKALIHLARNQVNFAASAARRGVTVTVFESAATPPMVSPAAFASAELPALNLLTTGVLELTGKKPPCIIGGNTEPILDSILQTKPGFLICPAETDQERFLERMRDHPDIPVRINLNVELLRREDPSALNQEVQRVLSLCRTRPGTVVGTGVLPYDIPPARILELASVVQGAQYVQGA